MSSFKDEETEIKSRVCKALIRRTHMYVSVTQNQRWQWYGLQKMRE